VQLLDLAIYSHDGRRRDLKFNTGALNVITGESETGKSALIEIIRYCLGSDSFRVPAGIIVDKVSWYGLRLQVNDLQVFVGRPRPPLGQASTNAMMLRTSASVDLPRWAELTANTNAPTVVATLGAMIGIADNQASLPDATSRSAVEATLDHALLFCFQRQGEVASQDFLFHRQNDEWIATHLRDTLPYFIGAVPVNYVVLQDRLRRTRLDLRRRQAELERLEASHGETLETARNLVFQAVEAGLVDSTGDWSTEELPVIRTVLQVALNAPINSETAARATGVGLDQLREAQRGLGDEYREARASKELIQRLIAGQADFRDAANGQADFMAAVDFLPDGESPTCPTCGQEAPPDAPTVGELRDALAELRGQIHQIDRDGPRLQRLLVAAEQRLEGVRGRLAETSASLVDLGRQNTEVEQLGSALNVQSYVRGRIDQFLGDIGDSGNDRALVLRRDIARLEAEIDGLRRQIGYEAVRDNVVSILNVVGSDMRVWAQRLQLGYAAGTVRIDWQGLTVVADTSTGAVPLNRMGSGKNWVGYHLVAYLALHKLFVEQGRPVPRFVVFDQPSQPFYSPAPEGNDDIVIASDADREAVARIFGLLRDVAADLAPQLQIIVLEHDNPDRAGLPPVVIDRPWRQGQKLVPTDWPTAATRS
jgi:hypothetical protein